MFKIECERNNITPKQFYNYCYKRSNNKINGFLESFEDFINPNKYALTKHTINNHTDWDEPQTEVMKCMPYDYQFYLQNTYNFIMEFEFNNDKKGHGYFYLIEM